MYVVHCEYFIEEIYFKSEIIFTDSVMTMTA